MHTFKKLKRLGGTALLIAAAALAIYLLFPLVELAATIIVVLALLYGAFRYRDTIKTKWANLKEYIKNAR